MNLRHTIWAFNLCIDYHKKDLEFLTWKQVKKCEDDNRSLVKKKLPGVLMPEQSHFFYADKNEDGKLNVAEWAGYVFSVVQCTQQSKKPLCLKYFPLDKNLPIGVNVN